MIVSVEELDAAGCRILRPRVGTEAYYWSEQCSHPKGIYTAVCGEGEAVLEGGVIVLA